MKLTIDLLSKLSIIILGLCALYIILQTFQNFLRPLSVAILITFLSMNYFRQELNVKLKQLGYFLVVVIAIFGIIYGISAIPNSSSQTDLSLNDYNSTNESFSVEEFEAMFTDSNLSNFVSFEKLNSFFETALNIALSSLTTLLSELFLILLFIAFIIPSYDPALKFLRKKYFKEDKKEFDLAIVEIEKGIKSYLSIKFMMSLGTALLSGFVLFFFGVNNLFLLTILIFALNFIPNVGSFVAVVIALGMYGFQDGLTGSLIVLAILLTGVQILFGNIVEPKVAGKGLNMSPLLILLALLFWGSLWGVGGMLISVPLTHAIKIILETLSKINT